MRADGRSMFGHRVGRGRLMQHLPRWPSCPPAFLPLGSRRLFVLRGVGASLSAVCQTLQLRVRSLRLSTFRRAFSASNSAMRDAMAMPLCYIAVQLCLTCYRRG